MSLVIDLRYFEILSNYFLAIGKKLPRISRFFCYFRLNTTFFHDSRNLVILYIHLYFCLVGLVQIDRPVDDHHGEKREREKVSRKSVDGPYIESFLLALIEYFVGECLFQFGVGSAATSGEVAVAAVQGSGSVGRGTRKLHVGGLGAVGRVPRTGNWWSSHHEILRQLRFQQVTISTSTNPNIYTSIYKSPNRLF